MVQTFMKLSLLVGAQMVLAERIPPSAAWRLLIEHEGDIVVVDKEVLLRQVEEVGGEAYCEVEGREGNLYLKGAC